MNPSFLLTFGTHIISWMKWLFDIFQLHVFHPDILITDFLSHILTHYLLFFESNSNK